MSKKDQEKPPDPTVEVGPRSFARFFEQVDQGEAHALASKMLHRVITASKTESSRRQGAKVKGRLTVTLDFEVEKDTCGVKYDFSIKEPKPAMAGSVFFVDKNNNLTREVPRQIGLPLREVGGSDQTREADGGERAIRE